MAFPAAFVLGMVTAWCPDPFDSVALCIEQRLLASIDPGINILTFLSH